MQRCSDGHMQGAEAEAVGVGEGGDGVGVVVGVGVGLKMCRGADGQMDRWTDVHILCRYAEVVQRWCREVQMCRCTEEGEVVQRGGEILRNWNLGSAKMNFF